MRKACFLHTLVVDERDRTEVNWGSYATEVSATEASVAS